MWFYPITWLIRFLRRFVVMNEKISRFYSFTHLIINRLYYLSWKKFDFSGLILNRLIFTSINSKLKFYSPLQCWYVSLYVLGCGCVCLFIHELRLYKVMFSVYHISANTRFYTDWVSLMFFVVDVVITVEISLIKFHLS